MAQSVCAMNIPDVICGMGIGIGYLMFFDGMVQADKWNIGVGCALALFSVVSAFWL